MAYLLLASRVRNGEITMLITACIRAVTTTALLGVVVLVGKVSGQTTSEHSVQPASTPPAVDTHPDGNSQGCSLIPQLIRAGRYVSDEHVLYCLETSLNSRGKIVALKFAEEIQPLIKERSKLIAELLSR